MELFSTLFGNPFRLIGVVAGLAFIASALCAFGVWAYLHWRIARAANEKLTGIAGALGSNLTLIAALMLFGLGTICAAGALVFPVPGTEIAMIPCPGITVTTLTATQLGATPCPTSSIGTGTPGGRNETATSTPTLARISPASTSTASPTPTFTPTFTATVPLRLTLTPVITRTVTITPSPTGRSMPATLSWRQHSKQPNAALPVRALHTM